MSAGAALASGLAGPASAGPGRGASGLPCGPGAIVIAPEGNANLNCDAAGFQGNGGAVVQDCSTASSLYSGLAIFTPSGHAELQCQLIGQQLMPGPQLGHSTARLAGVGGSARRGSGDTATAPAFLLQLTPDSAVTAAGSGGVLGGAAPPGGNARQHQFSPGKDVSIFRL